MKTLFLSVILLFGSLVTAKESRDLYIVNDRCSCSFSVAGYDFFPQELLRFPIELGDFVLVENERAQFQPNGSYQITVDITSIKHNISQEFTTRIIDNNELLKIKKALLTSRYDGVVTVPARDNGYRTVDCYRAEVRYDLILEDDSLYKMCYWVWLDLNDHNVEKLRATYFDPIVVSDGDYIKLGKGGYVSCHHKFQSFSAHIYHEGLELPSTVSVVGYKRFSNSFTNKKFKVTRSYSQSSGGLIPKDTHVVEFDNFGNGYLFTPILNASEINQGMTLEFVRATDSVYVFKTSRGKEIHFKVHANWNFLCYQTQDFVASFHRGT